MMKSRIFSRGVFSLILVPSKKSRGAVLLQSAGIVTTSLQMVSFLTSSKGAAPINPEPPI